MGFVDKKTRRRKSKKSNKVGFGVPKPLTPMSGMQPLKQLSPIKLDSQRPSYFQVYIYVNCEL